MNHARFIAVSLAAAAATAVPASARDYGQAGTVFAIAEPDLLEVIHTRLRRLQAAGEIDVANRAFARKTEARVRRPAPVPGIVAASVPRRWLVDPTITVPQDLRDARGRIVVAKGSRVNPLDTIALRQPLIFLDGDDPAQVAWARGTSAATAKLILVRGAPLDLMRTQQRRFFFDQNGVLTTRLGIRAVPAIVEQRQRILAVREIVLSRSEVQR